MLRSWCKTLLVSLTSCDKDYCLALFNISTDYYIRVSSAKKDNINIYQSQNEKQSL